MKMRKPTNSRSNMKCAKKTIIPEESHQIEVELGDVNENTGNDEGTNGFHACYLLDPSSGNGRTYIGSTADLRKRIRQHNGDIVGGPGFTKWGHPWKMVICIYGFKTAKAAHVFEKSMAASMGI